MGAERILHGNRWRVILILLALVIIVSIIFGSSYTLNLFILIGIYSIIALGLSLLMGYAGQVSLGHAAFFGIGAYTSGILTTTYEYSPWPAMLIGMVITAVIAYVVGIPTLKLKEFFLALATMGFNIIVFILLMGLNKHTGGSAGLTGIPKLTIFGLQLGNIGVYYFIWGIVLLLTLFSLNIVHSHIGRVLRAIHDSEIAASTQGVNVPQFKLYIFVLSAVFASLAGSLYAHYFNFIAPYTFYVTVSIHLLIMVIVGGVSIIWGAILGAFVITMLGQLVTTTLPLFFDVGGQVEIVVFGLLLVLVMIFMPKGLAPYLVQLSKKKQKRIVPSSKSGEVN